MAGNRHAVTIRAVASWDLLRQFAAAYADPLLPTADPAPVRAAEQRLALTLPSAFHELYSLLDDRDELTRGQGRLLPPAALYTDDGVLVFRHEKSPATAPRPPPTA
jgi:hypothetical protein